MNDRVRALREAVSVYDLLAERGITVASREKPQKIHCPVHDDTHKSAVVYPESNEVFCFAEGRTFDVVSLVMEWEALRWWEACAWLEERAGVVYERQSNPQDEFWRLVRRRGSENLSPKQAYDLRWAIHRSVLELCADRSAVDWDTFDVDIGVDSGKLRAWRERCLREGSVAAEGGGSLGRIEGSGVEAGLEGAGAP